MKIKVIETTDDRFIGVVIDLPNVGDIVKHDTENCEFHVDVIENVNGIYIMSNPNYVVYAIPLEGDDDGV